MAAYRLLKLKIGLTECPDFVDHYTAVNRRVQVTELLKNTTGLDLQEIINRFVQKDGSEATRAVTD